MSILHSKRVSFVSTYRSADDYLWNDSVKVLTTMQARTNLSKVIPGAGPKVPVAGDAILDRRISIYEHIRLRAWEAPTVFLFDKRQYLRRQGVSKARKSVLELMSINRAGAVAVKVREDSLPIRDVLPESRKFCSDVRLFASRASKDKGDRPLKPMVPFRSVSYKRRSSLCDRRRMLGIPYEYIHKHLDLVNH